MLAAAMPFPKEETTPPVTNIYLAMFTISALTVTSVNCCFLEKNRNSLPILRRIDAERFVVGFHHANLESVFERAQLFQALGALERPDRKIRIGQQKIAAVDVQSDVFEVRRSFAVGLADVRESASAKNRARCRPRPSPP